MNHAQNKEAIKEKSRERYKKLSQEEKDKIKEYQRKKVINVVLAQCILCYFGYFLQLTLVE